MPMNTNSVTDEELEREVFESVIDEEILYLWRSVKGVAISDDEAWIAVVVGLALDAASAKSVTSARNFAGLYMKSGR
jgi:hypothetical protein